MKQIETQLRHIDSFDRERYKEHLSELIDKTIDKSVIERYRNIISLIIKINLEIK
jgi:hypothetical protein